MKYFIKTFGCAANEADSERIAADLESRGMKKASSIDRADHVVINTCVVRESAENRVYGLVNNLSKLIPKPKIVLTGCMVGMAVREKKGSFLRKLKKAVPSVDEFLPIEEVGFDHAPVRANEVRALVPISNGCNNYCTFCVVPFTRGREASRPFDEILAECHHLKLQGCKEIVLVGQNVNSYGADLLVGADKVATYRDLEKPYFSRKKAVGAVHSNIGKLSLQPPNLPRPVYVRHLGRFRIPTLFPSLLDRVAKIGFDKVEFVSSNPWDFSDELIRTIAQNTNVSRTIHLPAQSGDNAVLKRMNRWYTKEEYLDLITRIRKAIPKVSITTDIIVGFCGETKKQFENTVDLCKKARFSKAYIAMYSDRPLTHAHKHLKDAVSHKEKKRRWNVLNSLINENKN